MSQGTRVHPRFRRETAERAVARTALLAALRNGCGTQAWAAKYGGDAPNDVLRRIWYEAIMPSHLLQIAHAWGRYNEARAAIVLCRLQRCPNNRSGAVGDYPGGRCSSCCYEVRNKLGVPTLASLSHTSVPA